MKKIFLLLSLLTFLNSLALAHRDSHIDNITECQWNARSVSNLNIITECNDLYHLYEPSNSIEMKRRPSLQIGAFNLFKLGAADSRFKDLKLLAKMIKKFDLVSVSEVQHALSEEFISNYYLATETDLNFAKYYHKPGYLKLLIELRKSNSSWALILSPSAQSDTEELLGFYFRTDRLNLESSNYCKSYNQKLRGQDYLRFSGSYQGETFGRESITPYLRKSYACLLDIEETENSIFRVPFTARFKMATGFDFQYLSYHARFKEPIAVGGTCGFECLEKINEFYDREFYPEGQFLGVVESKSLKFLKSHIAFLNQEERGAMALNKNYSQVIKFKHSKPRLYENLIQVKLLLDEVLPKVVDQVWEDSFKDSLSLSLKNKIKSALVELSESSDERLDFDFLRTHKVFLDEIFSTPPFSHIINRSQIWISPSKLSRFYELSLVLKEMEVVQELEEDSDVLLGGDLNLEDTDGGKFYWNYLSSKYMFSNLAIASPTSVSPSKGLNKSYDHFLYSASADSLEECSPLEASVLDFINDENYWEGFEKYFVNSKQELHTLSDEVYKVFSEIEYVSEDGKLVRAKDLVSSRGYHSCWDETYYKNTSFADKWKNKFECSLLRNYLYDLSPYRLHISLLSDHIPISLKCNKVSDLD